MPEQKHHTFTVGDEPVSDHSAFGGRQPNRFFWAVRVIIIFLAFLLALEWMGTGLKLIGKEHLPTLLNLEAHPFVGLFLGILATAVIQSSSTVTTMAVGLVASGTLGISPAVPIIFGANIGTSVTCMIVALGLIGQRKEFGRGVSTAALHGLFNIFVALLLFPLEVTTHVLSDMADWLASLLFQSSEVVSPAQGLLDISTRPMAELLTRFTSSAAFPEGNPYLIFPLGIIMLFLSLRLLTKSFEGRITGTIDARMNRYLFGHPRQAFLTGLLTTSVLQSSSVTTSLMVPLSANTKIALPRVFSYLIGANIGTTITAILAAIILGPASETALAIAFVHLLFNVFGAILLYPIPVIRSVPILLARKLGTVARDNRVIPVVYLIVLFFLIPGALVLLL